MKLDNVYIGVLNIITNKITIGCYGTNFWDSYTKYKIAYKPIDYVAVKLGEGNVKNILTKETYSMDHGSCNIGEKFVEPKSLVSIQKLNNYKSSMSKRKVKTLVREIKKGINENNKMEE